MPADNEISLQEWLEAILDRVTEINRELTADHFEAVGILNELGSKIDRLHQEVESLSQRIFDLENNLR